jgi:hypothetical protein
MLVMTTSPVSGAGRTLAFNMAVVISLPANTLCLPVLPVATAAGAKPRVRPIDPAAPAWKYLRKIQYEEAMCFACHARVCACVRRGGAGDVHAWIVSGRVACVNVCVCVCVCMYGRQSVGGEGRACVCGGGGACSCIPCPTTYWSCTPVFAGSAR